VRRVAAHAQEPQPMKILKKMNAQTCLPTPTVMEPIPTHRTRCPCPPKYETNMTTSKLPMSKLDTTKPDSALRNPYLKIPRRV